MSEYTLVDIIMLARHIAAERDGDIDTEDGPRATTDLATMIQLEEALEQVFNAPADQFVGNMAAVAQCEQLIKEGLI